MSRRRAVERRAPRRGVTLLELMVSIMLLSLLSVGILYSIRIGLNAMTQIDRRMISSRRAVGAQRILEQQIAGLMAVPAGCRPQPDAQPLTVPFFEGREASLRFVSSFSMSEGARGLPKVLEFAVIPGDKGRGVRLIVNEFPYTGPAALTAACMGIQADPLTQAPLPVFAPIQIGTFSFVLADRLAGCRFSYRFTPPPPAPPLEQWQPRWDHALYPEAIRIEFAPLEPDRTALPLLPLVAPVRITRDPTIRYWD